MPNNKKCTWKKLKDLCLDYYGLAIPNRKQGRYISWMGNDGQN